MRGEAVAVAWAVAAHRLLVVESKHDLGALRLPALTQLVAQAEAHLRYEGDAREMRGRCV